MSAIDVRQLTRVYSTTTGILRRSTKEIPAVTDVSFSVGEGELFGLLGPNGAGKTTTVKMLTTLLIPTSGRATVAGHDVEKDPREVQKRIGFIFGGERGLYWRLSAEDNLRYFASLYQVDPDELGKRIPRLLELVGLGDRGTEKVEGYSRGMKQRLHVARTLLHDPDILFLDEPTIGLDPVGARDFRQVIRGLKDDGKTILLTTHYMYEADLLCERIGVIDHGRIVAMDSPSELKKLVSDLSVVEIELFGAPDEVTHRLRSIAGVEAVSVEQHEQRQLLLVQTPRGPEALPEIIARLDGYKMGRAQVREPTLEDAYIRLVEGHHGGTADDAS